MSSKIDGYRNDIREIRNENCIENSQELLLIRSTKELTYKERNYWLGLFKKTAQEYGIVILPSWMEAQYAPSNVKVVYID